MMEKYKKKVVLIDEERKNYLLKKCLFNDVYKNNKCQLETMALLAVAGEFPKAILNVIIGEDELIKETCKDAANVMKDTLNKISCIRGYLSTDVARAQNQEHLLESISLLTIQE